MTYTACTARLAICSKTSTRKLEAGVVWDGGGDDASSARASPHWFEKPHVINLPPPLSPPATSHSTFSILCHCGGVDECSRARRTWGVIHTSYGSGTYIGSVGSTSSRALNYVELLFLLDSPYSHDSLHSSLLLFFRRLFGSRLFSPWFATLR